jgi:hemerythrin superfamily protein
MDAITLLKDDHHTVEALFKRFEKAGDRAYTQKRELVDRIIEELSKHAAVEEQLFYPVTRATVPGTDDVVLESIEEHHIVKWELAELEKLDPHDERFDAKVTVLIENVRHHVKEEENEYFPKVRDELGRRALAELGDAMAEAKAGAPTHPHPRAPQTPPGNLVAGNAAGVVDRVNDTVSGIAQGSLAAVGDLVGRVRGSKRPHPAPKGTTTARRTATKVRAGSDKVIDDTIEAVREAKSTGKQTATRADRTVRKTARAAKTGTKRTVGSARKGAKQTVTTGKQAATTTARTATRTAKAS